MTDKPPCPACDVQDANNQLYCLALGVALGAAFQDMHSVTELMCIKHRMPYVMAMAGAQVTVNTRAT